MRTIAKDADEGGPVSRKDLGTLPGGSYTLGWAINAAGQITGEPINRTVAGSSNLKARWGQTVRSPAGELVNKAVAV